MKEKEYSHGGARPGAGRKKAEGETHTYVLPADVALWIKNHGGCGYLTRLIRGLMAES